MYPYALLTYEIAPPVRPAPASTNRPDLKAIEIAPEALSIGCSQMGVPASVVPSRITASPLLAETLVRMPEPVTISRSPVKCVLAEMSCVMMPPLLQLD
jgi:hypothetical protein